MSKTKCVEKLSVIGENNRSVYFNGTLWFTQSISIDSVSFTMIANIGQVVISTLIWFQEIWALNDLPRVKTTASADQNITSVLTHVPYMAPSVLSWYIPKPCGNHHGHMFAWQELFIYIDKIFPFDLKDKYIRELGTGKRKSFFLEKKIFFLSRVKEEKDFTFCNCRIYLQSRYFICPTHKVCGDGCNPCLRVSLLLTSKRACLCPRI